MIALIARLLGVQPLAASLIVYGGAAALAGGAVWGWSAHKFNQGYSAGEAHERADWQDKMRLARIAQEAEAKTKQADIDAAAQEYIDQQDTDALKISALEDELAREKANAKPSEGKPAVCIATPRGVSNHLQGIGR